LASTSRPWQKDFFITGAGPMVEIFEDRIEVTNPGAPLMDTQRFVDTPPKSRNEALASLLRRMGICEERGSGWDKVVAETEAYQLPAPLAEATDEHTRVVLFAPRPLAKMDKADRVRALYLHACHSYRVEKRAAMKIQLADAGAEIGPVPTTSGGHKPEPELDRLSNIIKSFNDQFGNISWSDQDRIQRLITHDIPARVAADPAYQNAQKNSDKQNARIEHHKALARVMTAVLKDDTELFKQFVDNPEFKRWLADMVFASTYERSSAA
jgi:type I site-specific restriction-modification system R (restriction) subunit